MVALAACSDPFAAKVKATGLEQEEVCPAGDDWLPVTPTLPMFKPLSHPEGECPFYRGGWQNFLVALQPDAQGRPAILSYPTIDTVFKSKKVHPPNRAYLGGIKQAGGRQILIDQNGHTLYYGIHVNQAFADFIRSNGLETAEALQNYPRDQPNLFFPAGVVEFKSAWQVVDEQSPPADLDDFITITTTVPTLRVANGEIVEDRDTPRSVLVRLLAIHVVFTLPGHPEFVWASFEHSSGTPDTQTSDGKRDVAPTANGLNPVISDPNNLANTTVVSNQDHLLFKAGTPANRGNQAIPESELVAAFDEKTQSFVGKQTSIYRMFPASKSNTTDPDAAITSLNHNVEALFARQQGTSGPQEKRGHYRLLGAQWMDKPSFFKSDSPFQNDLTSPFAKEPDFVKSLEEEGSDSALSILAGEDRLSSTAMESFTQGPASFNNCFTCHNTQAITAKGVPFKRDSDGVKLLDPGLLNVSHVLSEFLLEEAQ